MIIKVERNTRTDVVNYFFKRISSFIFCITSLTICTVFVFAEENWNKEFTKEEITVYTRPVEGSSLKEFKGEVVINASIDACARVIQDTESHVKWRPDCIESRSIKKDGNTSLSYTETKAPWPVSNRDVVIKNTLSLSPEKITIEFIAINMPDLIPLKEGVVRMTELTGAWTLVNQNGSTLVTYQARINPSGSIPAWLANKTSIDQPFKTLQGLKQMVKDPKYVSE